MRGRMSLDRGGWTGSPNIPWAWYWFNYLYLETDQSIQSDCLSRYAHTRRGLTCPLSIAAKILALEEVGYGNRSMGQHRLLWRDVDKTSRSFDQNESVGSWYRDVG